MQPNEFDSLERVTRILIVEDDEDDFLITKDYLEEMKFLSFDITRVLNAKDAIQKLSTNTHDLCLLDYQLGAINGIDVLLQARELNITCPIIMLTGQANEELDAAALEAGAADYLVKSEINSSRFIRSIRYALSRRELEVERVERLKAEAENKTKNLFLAHLSHELRTPLTSILGYTELLLDSQLGKVAGAELQVILRNGQHLLNLLNDVLDLSKIAADKLELNLHPVNLKNLIADTYSLLRVSAIDKGLWLTVDCDGEMPIQITTDGTRLRQILINIINNAIKFTDAGGIILRISVVENMGKERVLFEIIDTGVGIPKDKLQSIFKPFEQVADVISKSTGGSGLGLAISAALAQRLGGDIRVESQVNKGSTFFLQVDPGDLSGSPRERLNIDKPMEYEQDSTTVALTGKVLVVDDIRDIRRLIGHIVQRAGCEVSYASNGLSAVAAIKSANNNSQPYDVILMDIHMPQMNGEDTVKYIRHNKLFSGPIIALTAVGLKGTRERLMSTGFTDSLSKPVETEKLVSLLSQYLAEVDSSVRSDKADLKHEQQVVPASESNIKILIIEDDEDAAEAIKMLLESQGAVVETAHTAKEFRQLIYKMSWDIILLDLNLPDANGFDIVEEIRNDSDAVVRNTYITLISGQQLDIEKVASLQINHQIMKPIRMKDLKELLENYKPL